MNKYYRTLSETGVASDFHRGTEVFVIYPNGKFYCKSYDSMEVFNVAEW